MITQWHQAALSCRPGDVDALELLFRAQSELMERGKAQAGMNFPIGKYNI